VSVKKILKLGLPKGSLEEATLYLFKKAGFLIDRTARSYLPRVDEPEFKIQLIRAQEIPRYVSNGVLDAGISGQDWIEESGARVKKIVELTYSKQGFRKVKWVLAVPQNSKIRSLEELNGKRIATEVVNLTKRFLAERKIKAEVEFSWGATEAKPPELADAIVELTETGTSLAANNLRVLETVLESSPFLIANTKAWQEKWKKHKLENLAILLQGALQAEGMVGLKMNLKRLYLSKVLSLLPALKNPTISNLTNPDWVALEVVLKEKEVRTLLPELKRAGAEGIVEYPLNKVVY
jgi:ATP phosphoribosyltransferase